MSVQVAVCTASQLFSESLWHELNSASSIITNTRAQLARCLHIPEYQRPYPWSSEQLSALLNDIRQHRERLKQTKNYDLSYYLGSLILHQNEGRLNIIDGQQCVTTLALLTSLLHPENNSFAAVQEGLSFEHEISQQQILKNLNWLRSFFRNSAENWRDHVDLNKLQFSLVITQSEDDAYRFFETQNTGGRRLSGPDIIKAHHLRAIKDLYFQKHFALHWESLGRLDDVVGSLLRGRYWQQINMRELPSHRQANAMRSCVVAELAEDTGAYSEDVAYGRNRITTGLAGEVSQHFAQQGYDVRQPLNAGVNTIRYLAYFQELDQRYWEKLHLPHLAEYQRFIEWLKGLKGCGYLADLYRACLLIYISQFGEDRLETAAKKLFRVVYSRRLSNQKAVRENSIPAFIRESPVLDWIALSYTPEQCFDRLDNFELEVNESNIKDNSVKRRFLLASCDFFKLDLKDSLKQNSLEPNEIAAHFKEELDFAIRALK